MRGGALQHPDLYYPFFDCLNSICIELDFDEPIVEFGRQGVRRGFLQISADLAFGPFSFLKWPFRSFVQKLDENINSSFLLFEKAAIRPIKRQTLVWRLLSKKGSQFREDPIHGSHSWIYRQFVSSRYPSSSYKVDRDHPTAESSLVALGYCGSLKRGRLTQRLHYQSQCCVYWLFLK